MQQHSWMEAQKSRDTDGRAEDISESSSMLCSATHRTDKSLRGAIGVGRRGRYHIKGPEPATPLVLVNLLSRWVPCLPCLLLCSDFPTVVTSFSNASVTTRLSDCRQCFNSTKLSTQRQRFASDS